MRQIENLKLSFKSKFAILKNKHLFDHCVKSVRIWNYSGPYSVRMWENTDQNNSEYGHFLLSGLCWVFERYSNTH